MIPVEEIQVLCKHAAVKMTIAMAGKVVMAMGAGATMTIPIALCLVEEMMQEQQQKQHNKCDSEKWQQ